MLHPGVLSEKQQKVLKSLSFLGKEGIYLAGGTALALYLNHRTSIDLDFYSQKSFRPEKMLSEFKKRFPTVLLGQTLEDTLIITIEGIGLSLFYYPYKLIGPLVFFETISLASIEDIAAMKIAAIVQRGTRRDFIDVFYLLEKYSLEEIVKFVLWKYPGYQEMLILRALAYFEDAEEEGLERGIKIFAKNFSWEKTKERIFEEVKKYQLRMLEG